MSQFNCLKQDYLQHQAPLIYLPLPLMTKSTYLSGSRDMPSRPLINITALLPMETKATFTGAIGKTQTATSGSLVVYARVTNTMSLIPLVSNEISKQNRTITVTSSFVQIPMVPVVTPSMNSNLSANGTGRGSSLTLCRHQTGCESNRLISLKQNKHRQVNKKKRRQNLYKSPFCRVTCKPKGKVSNPSNLKSYSADTGISEGKCERKSQPGNIGVQKKRLSIATRETFWSYFD